MANTNLTNLLEVSFQFRKCSWSYHITHEKTRHTGEWYARWVHVNVYLSTRKHDRHMVLKRKRRIWFYESNFWEICRVVVAINRWFQKLQPLSSLNSVFAIYVIQCAFAFTSRQDVVILKMAKRSKDKMNLLRDSNSNASTMLLSLHDAHSQKMDHTDVVSKM